MPRFPARHEPLAACAGRVLAEDIHAERDQPPFDRVTMDGVAIAFRDWAAGERSFEVLGTQAAGAEPLAVGAASQCVEVMTGTPLPRGVDTVVPVERVRRSGTTAAIEADATVKAEQFVHRRGTDRTAGSLVLRAGTRLGPPEMAVLAGAGRGNALVDRPAARRRHLDGRRARRGRQTDRSAPDSVHERSRDRGQPDATPVGSSDARALARRRRRACSRDRSPRHRARRARIERRRLDGPVRFRSLGARRSSAPSSCSTKSRNDPAGRCGSASAHAASQSSLCRAIPFRHSSVLRATSSRRCARQRARRLRLPELVELTAPIEASPTLTLFTAGDAVVIDPGDAARKAASDQHVGRLRDARRHGRLRRARGEARHVSARHRRTPFSLVVSIRTRTRRRLGRRWRRTYRAARCRARHR